MPVDALEEAARDLLAANTRTAERGGQRYRFSIPAEGAYPFQWFWDSCFHAIVWSRFDRERAADELRSLLAWQRPDGLVPHVVFWDASAISVRAVWHHLESRGIPYLRVPRTSEYVQPPVLAHAVERIGGEFVAEAYPAVAAFYRYLARERDPDGDGLVSTLVQFESGLDYSPVYGDGHHNPVTIYLASRRPELVNKLLGFDTARIFRLTDHHRVDVLYNAVYADGLRVFARLARACGDEETATWADETAARVTDALVARCWDEERGLFFNLAGREDRRMTRRTIISLLPLLLEDLPESIAARLVAQLEDEQAFWTPFPVPSVPRDDETFLRDSHLWGIRFIWRGPCSMNTNWFLVHGLRRHGRGDLAETIVERSRLLAERGGFNEFYDPLDGRPVGAKNFGWATLVVDL